jgi:hypothetical protein
MAQANRSGALCICFAAGLVTVTLSRTSHATECFPGPDFQAPAGTQWQYQRVSATNEGCWYVAHEPKNPKRSSRSGALSPPSQKSTTMVAPQAARQAATPASNGWFPFKFSDVTNLPDSYSATDPDALRKLAVTPARSPGSRAISKAIRGKTEQQNKIAQRKPNHERGGSDGAQDRYSTSAVALLEAAGDKPVPGLLPHLAPSDLRKVKEAIGDKDVVAAAPAKQQEDWQQALYEEFVRWRLKQVGRQRIER